MLCASTLPSHGVLRKPWYSATHFKCLLYRFARMFRQLAFNYRLGIATSVPSDRNLDGRCLPHCGFRGRIEYFQQS